MQLKGRVRSEAGFTLVELLVAIVIIGIVTVPLANVVISALRNTTDTSDRLALSHDAQISATYFARDVAGVGVRDYGAAVNGSGTLPFKQSVQQNAAYDEGGKACGIATTPIAAVRFLSDSWDHSVSPAAVRTDIVAYYLDGTELHRIKCVGDSPTPVSDATIAHYVDPSTVFVTCSSDCQSTTVPDQITLKFSATKPSIGAYPITLVGQRRQS